MNSTSSKLFTSYKTMSLNDKENNLNVTQELVKSDEEYFEDPVVIDSALAVDHTLESSAREYQLKSITKYEDKRVKDKNNFNVGEEVVISEEDIVIIKEEYFEDPVVIDSALAVDHTSESSARECQLSKSITNYEDQRVKENNNFNFREDLGTSEEDIVIIKEEYFEEDPDVTAVDHTIEYSAKDKRVNGKTVSDTLNANYYACNECGKQFSEKKNLTTHNKTHFNCDLCNRQFTIKSTFEKHMVTHTENRCCYACDVCDKKFFNKSHFMRHKKIHKKGLTCDVCKKKIRHKHSLAAHMRTHTGEKPYKCNICEISYSHNSTLVAHIRTHTGQKPYACCICERNFSQKSYLISHLRTHSGAKPFACSICDKTFKQKSSLNIHLRVHTGVKDYACDKCEMKFSNASSLGKHKKTHNKKKISKKGLTKLKKAQSSVSQVQATESHENLEAITVQEKHSTDVHIKHEFVTSEEENTSAEYINIQEEFVKEEPVVTAIDIFAIEQPINRYL